MQFQIVDTDNNGLLSLKEAQAYILKEYGIGNRDVERIWRLVLPNSNMEMDSVMFSKLRRRIRGMSIRLARQIIKVILLLFLPEIIARRPWIDNLSYVVSSADDWAGCASHKCGGSSNGLRFPRSRSITWHKLSHIRQFNDSEKMTNTKLTQIRVNMNKKKA